MERLSKEQIEAVIQEAKERCPYYGEPDGCNAHGGPLMCCDELDEVGELAKTACSLGPVEELSALVNARDEGRVVVLPCKVGDTVYRPQLAESVPLKEMVCCGYRIYEGGINVMCKESGIEFPLIFTLGKTAYLTRAEAEAAIGGGQT